MAIDPISLGNQTLLPGLTTRGRMYETIPSSDMQGPDTAISGTSSFADMLESAMTDAVVTDAAAKTDAIGLLLGQNVDLHNISISAEKAELMLNLTIQMRNKVVESYQEVMRMSI